MIVVSHFSQPAPASLENHRWYAQVHGYRHEIVDACGMPQALPLRPLHRYESLLHVLRGAQPGELVLLLSEDAAIIHPVALDRLMAGRDTLFVDAFASPLPQVDVQIWRNTPDVRAIVMRLAQRCKLGSEPRLTSEAALFADLDTHGYMTPIDGLYAVMPSGPDLDPMWSRAPTFAISIDDTPRDPERKGATPRFRDTLVAYVNRCRAAGRPMFSFDHDAAVTPDERAERTTYHPGRPIALMMLYTPNIGSYARVAERNFRRYCDAHGYTLYVHRDIPAEIGLNATGNWFKPWLLHAYLQHHEWVVWLDADVLIANQQQPLEPLLEGRDWLLAQDIGQWAFNSGVMAFRRTERNDAMLRDLMTTIAALHDRSSVYASDGDQLHFIRAMERDGQLHGEGVADLVSLNTPWLFRRADSYVVHYYGMWSAMRALMMAHDDGLLP
ncbi:galactosyl transferase GMA12/MNN10 domain protein [Burkholderia cenocepacia]|uniref:galactosyl transferase GMA12/MNN10 domain protein n=1 Tax=Burkholderia cenocepacia TaxID=95486 RepID=UPI00222E540A|nr:galactosyl transferase GMA12/MNN10 domain protein [Burkholderia cenocepacia]MCW3662481.1 galactosyl transferase GMA12/MNN10 domain protein [Burkholderia cenocepacia]MDS0806683.1 galactosyl transferase GMA12/MNN10 domain protein [Burkholderia cenocepacia]